MWKLTPDNKVTTLKQVWFPGVHSSTGGGEPDHGLSNIALYWMVQQLHNYTDLEIDIPYLLEVRSAFGEDPTSRPWATGPWFESLTGMFLISGLNSRTPGKYFTKDHEVTNEFIHKSVSERKKWDGDSYIYPDLGDLKEDEFGETEKTLGWLDDFDSK
jgi:hypothetical protein